VRPRQAPPANRLGEPSFGVLAPLRGKLRRNAPSGGDLVHRRAFKAGDGDDVGLVGVNDRGEHRTGEHQVGVVPRPQRRPRSNRFCVEGVGRGVSPLDAQRARLQTEITDLQRRREMIMWELENYQPLPDAETEAAL
jgi:hypothetical protein